MDFSVNSEGCPFRQPFLYLRVNQSCGGVKIIVQVHHADRFAELSGQTSLDRGDRIIIVKSDIFEEPAALAVTGAHDAHAAHGRGRLSRGGNNVLGIGWAKFKLDGKYDTFEANIVTSDDTSRDANMSVEVYVDDVLVGRVDNIVRDENVLPISVSVNGGKVLMIKAVNTNETGNSYCYITDTKLTVLQ